MINEALGKCPVIEKKRLKFPVVSTRYLIAAVILLSIVSFTFLIRKIDVRYLKEEIKTSQFIEDDTINNNQNFRKKNSIGPEIYSQNRIVTLDSGTTAVVDSGAELTDIEIKDKVVSLLVVKGSVSFSVSKKRSRKFIVRTGIADIIVTGTQFRGVRIDDVLSVAVNEGSVNTVYNAGGSSVSLSTGQASLIYGDTITVIKNDSFPVFPKRKLLGTIIGSSDEDLTTDRLISGAVADSLLHSLFTPGALYLRKTELLKNFSTILQSQGRYSDALNIMKYFPKESCETGSGLNVLKMKSELLLKNCDTTDAVDCLEDCRRNMDVLLKGVVFC
jgi:hypothetical protein